MKTKIFLSQLVYVIWYWPTTTIRQLINRQTIEIYKYKNPLMIIHGEEDRLWTVKNVYQLQDNYEKNGNRAVVETIPNRGHEKIEENSKAFNLMINFLSGT